MCPTQARTDAGHSASTSVEAGLTLTRRRHLPQPNRGPGHKQFPAPPPHSTPSTRVHLRNAIERAAPAKQTTRVSRDPRRGARSSPAGFSDTCPCHVHRRWPAAQAARGLLAAWRTRLTELHAAGGWGQWQPGPWAPRRGEPTEQEALGRQLRGEAQV